MKRWVRKKREVKRHVEGYKEGRRLMRQGDGADEWIGMDITRKHLRALTSLGYDTEGQKVSLERRMEILREHGLRKDAILLDHTESLK